MRNYFDGLDHVSIYKSKPFLNTFIPSMLSIYTSHANVTLTTVVSNLNAKLIMNDQP
jgi:hypothetical protein